MPAVKVALNIQEILEVPNYFVKGYFDTPFPSNCSCGMEDFCSLPFVLEILSYGFVFVLSCHHTPGCWSGKSSLITGYPLSNRL